MRNKWYGDSRDLVKWSVLIHIADKSSARRIIQIAYFRQDSVDKIDIDGELYDIPSEALKHFRDLRRIETLSSYIKISVFDKVFNNREDYLNQVKEYIKSFADHSIVFLDPDTGLEPKDPNLKHVLEIEVFEIWSALKENDILVFYQHQTNRDGQPWIDEKRTQLEKAIKVSKGSVKVAYGPMMARDVAFFYISK